MPLGRIFAHFDGEQQEVGTEVGQEQQQEEELDPAAEEENVDEDIFRAQILEYFEILEAEQQQQERLIEEAVRSRAFVYFDRVEEEHRQRQSNERSPLVRFYEYLEDHLNSDVEENEDDLIHDQYNFTGIYEYLEQYFQQERVNGGSDTTAVPSPQEQHQEGSELEGDGDGREDT